MQEHGIEDELQQKAVVIRDGARGWRLSSCFIEDALALLNADEAKRAEYAIPPEDEADCLDDYLETVTDTADELERELSSAGYTVFWNDGYVIYKGLSEAALKALAEDY